MKEACGVVGIVAPGKSVAPYCYDALYALQHRGQESAGMAVSAAGVVSWSQPVVGTYSVTVKALAEANEVTAQILH